jgi:heterodisulfide reductase subunit D
MGGPTHCCGISQLRAGDVETSGRMGSNSIEKMSHAKSGQVISWCPLLRRPVNMRLALHRHPGVAGVMEAATDILQAIPGVELVDLKQPAVGLQSVNVGVLPAFKRELQLDELQAAANAGVDALVAVYHSDHRELCAHERDWPFRIVNVLEVVGESMGLHREDRYKQLKLMQDADQIVSECRDLIAQHALDAGAARSVVAKGMLGDQPLPLK